MSNRGLGGRAGVRGSAASSLAAAAAVAAVAHAQPVPPPPPMAPPPPRMMAPPPMAPPPMAPPPPRMMAPPPPAAPAARAPAAAPAIVAETPAAGAPPCRGVRVGTLCFSPVSQKTLQFAELDDYCAELGMKVPGIAEYRYAMPRAQPGLFPPRESLWMSEAWQYNRNMEELGSAVVWYGPGQWNSGPMSASTRLRVACVDRLLAAKATQLRLHYVGIPKERLAQLARTSTQRDAMWCWAAVAQMILWLRGQSLSQDDIARAALGDVIGKGVSSAELARRLQSVGITATEDRFVPREGVKFKTSADGKTWQPMSAYNPLGEAEAADNVDSRQLALELMDGTVYILAYGTGASRAHAVLLVGLDVSVAPDDFTEVSRFQIARYSHKIAIAKYHVINPWPGKGYQVLSPDELQELVKWKVNMPQRAPHGPL